MAYPEPHYLFAFGGSLHGTEEWSMGLRFASGFALGTQAEEETAHQALHDVLAAWFPVNGVSGAPTSLTYTKFNRIGTDGRYVNDYTNLIEPVAPIAAPGGSNYPNQISCVVTLETGFARGLAHRGRMFFPLPRYSLNASGRLSAASAQTIADNVAGLLGNLNAAEPNLTVNVFSPTREGARRPVTAVTVGDVLDTMRSRREQMEEVRSEAAVAASP